MSSSQVTTVELLFSGLFAFFPKQRPVRVAVVSGPQHRFDVIIVKESPTGTDVTHFPPKLKPLREIVFTLVDAPVTPLETANIEKWIPVLDPLKAKPVPKKIKHLITIHSATFRQPELIEVCVRPKGSTGRPTRHNFATFVPATIELIPGAKLLISWRDDEPPEEIQYQQGVNYKIILDNNPPVVLPKQAEMAERHFDHYYDAFEVNKRFQVDVDLCSQLASRAIPERLCLSTVLVNTELDQSAVPADAP